MSRQPASDQSLAKFQEKNKSAEHLLSWWCWMHERVLSVPVPPLHLSLFLGLFCSKKEVEAVVKQLGGKSWLMYKQDAGITHILAGGMRRCLFPLLLPCLHYSRDEQPVAPAAIQPACSILAAHAADRAQHSP